MFVASMLRLPRACVRFAFGLALLASPSLALAPVAAHAQTMSADIVDTAVNAGNFATLATALEAAGLVDTLKGPGPLTVFAPTDAAFAKLPAGTLDSLLADPDKLRAVLTYHVVSGKLTAADVVKLQSARTVQGEDVAISSSDGIVHIGGATVMTPDVMASNGVIHVVDSVLLPPSFATAQHAAPSPTSDIVDTAVAAGEFTTLARALDAAGLTDTLKGPGPFTVFAPTDAAFGKLPAGTLDSLLADPDTLRSVLTYHVVPGRVTAADAANLQTATSVEGEDVSISADDGGVQIDNADVTQPDVMASNGIIHGIDAVMLPPSLVAQTAGE
jgi:transforming growth factor-beta-induced protein